MREWDKMLAGELYDPADAELKAGREAARTILFELQQLPPNAKEQRRQLWERLLGSAKGAPAIPLPFHCDYGRNIHLGELFSANPFCPILRAANDIGQNVGHRVTNINRLLVVIDTTDIAHPTGNTQR